MKLITRQDRANKILDTWNKRCEWIKACDSVQQGADEDEITRKLAALPTPVDPDEVDKIMGNPSWTHIVSCDICGAHGHDRAVQFDLQTEFDGCTLCATICPSCAHKIGELCANFEAK